jgi:DNA polymerase III gamma/tau subunit
MKDVTFGKSLKSLGGERKAWKERRRVSATADAATATAEAGAATIEVATAAARGGGAANPLSVVAGAAVLAAPVNTEVKEASAAATAAVAEEVSTCATAAVSAAAAATAAVLQRAKVAVCERRTSTRAQILARRRESEGSEVLRSPDPVVSELEISWASGEQREELECTENALSKRWTSFYPVYDVYERCIFE